MKLNTDAEVKKIVEICRKYDDLSIDACCENNEYLVDAKSLGGMRLLKGGGEVYFRPHGEDGKTIGNFIKDLVEASNEEKEEG